MTFIRTNLPNNHGLVFFSVTVSELDKLLPGECRYSERFCVASIGMQWKLRRCDLLSDNPILLAVDYFSVPNTVEGDQGRPSVSLCVWSAYKSVYVDTETKNGWFATKNYCWSGDICSFRAVLGIPA